MDKKEQWKSIQQQDPILAEQMRNKTDNGMSECVAKVNREFGEIEIVISKKSTGG